MKNWLPQILHDDIDFFETNAGQLDELPTTQHHGVILDIEKKLTKLISEFRSSMVMAVTLIKYLIIRAICF